MSTHTKKSTDCGSLIHPAAVMSHDMDAATIDATRDMIGELRRQGFSVEAVADTAAEHLADAVARYGAYAMRSAS